MRLHPLAVLYAAFAILAFGHAYQQLDGTPGSKVTEAFVCALAWPLYASVQFQKEPL